MALMSPTWLLAGYVGLGLVGGQVRDVREASGWHSRERVLTFLDNSASGFRGESAPLFADVNDRTLVTSGVNVPTRELAVAEVGYIHRWERTALWVGPAVGVQLWWLSWDQYLPAPRFPWIVGGALGGRRGIDDRHWMEARLEFFRLWPVSFVDFPFPSPSLRTNVNQFEFTAAADSVWLSPGRIFAFSIGPDVTVTKSAWTPAWNPPGGPTAWTGQSTVVTADIAVRLSWGRFARETPQEGRSH